ncbi:MAG: cytochrome b5-like heme/steroid binding domain-containing protein [Patescibacteria group bacterium]
MTQKQLPVIGGIVVILAIIIGVTVYSKTHGYKTPTAPPSADSTSYTMDQLATHKDGTSCWTTVDGTVYDLTTWISQHPGGRDAILLICGKDGTAAFHEQHDGQPQPATMLASFKIGTLSK